ncbi:M48 family metalloprotease [uncultured Modestobacter sp.]|uniref:M48 family metalloprotease n=1 Tax=uncultured Modestobacter sp. TaxID=380048 RepID=UPI00261C3401|nr:M48 family metalloprotease [uncultured Modestobacter sp.]
MAWDVEQHGHLSDHFEGRSITPSVVIVPGTRPSASVRGPFNRPVVVLSRAAALHWQRNPMARESQWAHECAHIGLADSLVYYHLSSALVIAVLVQLTLVRSDPYTTVALLLIAVLAAANSRGYSRARELAADAISAGVVGDAVRDQLANHTILDTPRFGLLAFHPSVTKRVEALGNPKAIFSGLSLPCATLGGIAVVLAGQLNVLLSRAAFPIFDIPLSAILAAALVGGAVARTLSFGSLLRPRWTPWWLLSLVAGSFLATVVLTSPRRSWLELAALFASAGVFSVMVAAILVAVSFALWFISRRDGDEFDFRMMGIQSTIAAVMVASAWVSPLALLLSDILA